MISNFKKVTLCIIFCGLGLLAQGSAFALFELSVTPRRGGQNIRFEQSQPGSLVRNEEVTLSVESDETAQYRILQTFFQPLTNESGNVIPQDAFIVFSPSNPLGTLRTQLETPITMGQVPIYTSNAAGDSDSFILVFSVRIPENQPGGVYHTQLTYTTELVSPTGGVSPRVFNLDVRLEIRPTFRVEIKNAKGGRDLNLGRITKDNPAASEALNIEIESNIGTTYRVVQQLTEPLISQTGEMLEEGVLSFLVSGTGSQAEVSQSPSVIYSSTPAGESNVIQIQYTLAPESAQKSGIYSGTLSFKIESNSFSAPSDTFNIPVRIEIEPIFYLDVEMMDGSGIHFGTFRTGDENQKKSVHLTVHSNMGEPYQVSQIVARKLTNVEGSIIPESHFLYFGADGETGSVKVKSPASVQEGESVVFTSDNKGTPDEFTLNYLLSIPTGTKAGSYSSEVRYSITTL